MANDVLTEEQARDMLARQLPSNGVSGYFWSLFYSFEPLQGGGFKAQYWFMGVLMDEWRITSGSIRKTGGLFR